MKMSEDEYRKAIETLRGAPALVDEATRGLAPERARGKPPGGAFSILENVAHLHDIEREGYLVRVRRLIEEDHPSLEDLDGERLAIERSYNRRDLRSEVRAFATARLETLELLQSATVSTLGRLGELEQVGTISLARLVGMMIEHDRGHLEEIERLKVRTEEPG
ncbi:MAG TPA: DinB family protein [Patescibacteria group bacterium]|nr:DinB family protein [Patescibacteria group bacterium]